MQTDQLNELAEAMSKAQAAMTGAKKDSENPFFKSKYADLHAVLEAVKKPLSDNDLCVIQTIECDNIVTTLMHKSGQWIRGACPIINTKGDAQGMGSAITYARRYSLAAICGIAQMDDDANDAVQPSQTMNPEPINFGKVKAATKAFKEVIDADDLDAGHERAKSARKRLTPDEWIAVQSELNETAPDSRKKYKTLAVEYIAYAPEASPAATGDEYGGDV